MNHLLTTLFRHVFEYIIQQKVKRFTFEQVLVNNWHNLKRICGKFIKDAQWDLLYPAAASAAAATPPITAATSSEEFDVTLLMVLVRNLEDSSGTPIFSTPCPRWDFSRLFPTNMSIEADFMRVQSCRNIIQHNTKVTEDEFKQMAMDMKGVVDRLGKLVVSPFENSWLDTLKDVLVGETEIE